MYFLPLHKPNHNFIPKVYIPYVFYPNLLSTAVASYTGGSCVPAESKEIPVYVTVTNSTLEAVLILH